MTAAVARGDIILIPFPFTDLSGRKVRPAVVVNVVGDDVLVAFISSVVPPMPPASTDLLIPANHPDFVATGLKTTSLIKLAKLVCLHQSLIVRKLGHLSGAFQREADVRLARAVGLA